MDYVSTSSTGDRPTEISVDQVIDAPTLPQQNIVNQLTMEVLELKERNDALANAVINSAEIIEELEDTKRLLAEAQSATERAHQDTRRMADTIFDGTHDAMLVLNAQFELLSANRVARSMFGLDLLPPGSQLMKELTRQYRSEGHQDWFTTLIVASSDAKHRLELYRETSADDPNSNSERHWIALSISVLEGGLEGAEFLLTAHDITQRKRIEYQFQHQALHDNVTGLPNRRYFVQEIEKLLSSADDGTSFAVCFLDLDNFKTVNDTLGHEAGDQLLVKVAERIQSVIRSDSLLARFGGDEFALLMPDLPAATVTLIGKRVVSELKRSFSINGNKVYIGASVGMTRFPIDAMDVNSLLQNADVAMYSAKERGRSCFHPFTPELAAGIQERQNLLDDLREAIDRKEIDLEYQPKWCLQENRIAGCEALMRFRRNGVVVPPAHLIEVAECSGLILQLGDLVIETAIRQMARWKQSISLNGTMAINVSPRQLVNPDFVDRFMNIVSSIGVDPEIVELEITETAMIKNFDQAFEQIRKLKQAGVSIAIDDFGTGYSSLSYLKSFPVTTLKIDRSFVKDLPMDPKAVAVAKAVLSLGHGLGLKVVAEGVEILEQCDFLRAAGCDQVQGFLFSPSLPVEQFEQWAIQSV